MKMEKLGFQAEVSRLLDIVAHSLYSDRAVFLRELISNASDACDKLRYLSLTEPGLLADDPEFGITVAIDKGKKTLTVSDNGIGMNREELISHLGTIARSGSAQFVQAMEEGKSKDVSLIGQFGVGFYAAFMVADEVTVVSRKAGEAQAWTWVSDGKGEFAIGETERAGRGTDVVLHIKKDAEEFLEKARISTIITKYSDHIALPIRLVEGAKEEKVNQAAALWTRSKSDITEEQYRDFYRHVAHAFDEPWGTLHFKAEGKIEYTGLIFIPGTKPFDLFHPDRKQSLKLYVKRVFITDHCEELLPSWLRFLKGLVDSEDLPLNISREMLQQNPVLAKIRQGVVKRVLEFLKKKAENDADSYAKFWDNFGAVLKEGLYEEAEHKDALLKLARFRSTAGSTGGDALVSLADYIGRMKEGQSAIYYLTGDSLEAAARSPQLEGYRAKGIEVLLLTDGVDEFWVPAIGEYEGKGFKSVTRGGADLESIKGDAKADEKKPELAAAGIDKLIALMKLTLKDAVKDVRVSQRLTDSAVCLIADEGDMDMRLARLLQQHKRIDALMPRVLEINGSHPVIAALAKALSNGKGDAVADASWLLLDQARIQEGETLSDPTAFAKRLGEVLGKAFA